MISSLFQREDDFTRGQARGASLRQEQAVLASLSCPDLFWALGSAFQFPIFCHA